MYPCDLSPVRGFLRHSPLDAALRPRPDRRNTQMMKRSGQTFPFEFRWAFIFSLWPSLTPHQVLGRMAMLLDAPPPFAAPEPLLDVCQHEEDVEVRGGGAGRRRCARRPTPRAIILPKGSEQKSRKGKEWCFVGPWGVGVMVVCWPLGSTNDFCMCFVGPWGVPTICACGNMLATI